MILHDMIWYDMIQAYQHHDSRNIKTTTYQHLPIQALPGCTHPCPASLLAVEAAWLVAWLLLLPKFLGADDADWLLKILLLDKIGGAGAALDAVGVLGYPASAILPISLEGVVDFKSVRGLDPIHLLPLGLKLLHGPPRTSGSQAFGWEAE